LSKFLIRFVKDFWELIRAAGNLIILVLLLVLLPLGLLVSWLVSYFGIEGMRVRGAELQTPVLYYRHLANGRKVVFVSTIHLASQKYFALLQEKIAGLERGGCRVLFERVGPSQRPLTDAEKRWDEELDEVLSVSLVEMIEGLLRLIYQTDGLDYLPSWQNTDLTRDQIASRLVATGIEPSPPKSGSDRDWTVEPNRTILQWCAPMIFRHLLLALLWGKVQRTFSRYKRVQEQVIVGERNQVAFTGIVEGLKTSFSVVTIWGAAHWPGIHRMLRKAGFVLERTEYLSSHYFEEFPKISFQQVWDQIRVSALLKQGQ